MHSMMSTMITPLCHRGVRPQRNRKCDVAIGSRRTCSTTIEGSSSPLIGHTPDQEEAAKLLMDVRSLALKEVEASCDSTTIQLVSEKKMDLPKSPQPMQVSPRLPSTPTTRRQSSIVSVCSMDDEEDHVPLTNTIMLPTESTPSEAACITPITTDSLPVFNSTNTKKLPESLFLHSLSPGSRPTIHRAALPLQRNMVPYTPQHGKKLVGNTLPTDTPIRNVLRKKFSWKSFPELETYLIDHREQYLSYSSSLNYTKTQKLYNNHLTQGLLDLAAEQGYVFEGFTFAAIRDRIRCFYKSYVQAIKKKKKSKRSKQQQKQQYVYHAHRAAAVVL